MGLDKDLSIRLLKLFNYLKNNRQISSQRDFCTKIGISESFFTEIKKGRSGITADKLQNIQEELQEYSNWLITGSYPPVEFEQSVLKDSARIYNEVALTESIPLIPFSALAGAFNGEMSVLEYECERFVIPTFKGADFLISVKGSSMFPRYSSGDIVACKKLPIDTFFQWGKVYVLDTDQGPLIKKVKKGADPNFLLILSENSEFEPFELNRSAVYHIALVLGVIRLE